jgi:XTP/dITP diphosphohydrolase
VDAPAKILLASSNRGKLVEFQALAAAATVSIPAMELFPEFASLPEFEEAAPTFAENAAGKAAHYSRFTELAVLADDSGLVVPALGGAPGVHSARYAGPDASDADRIQKLIGEMRGKSGDARTARFVCVLAAARRGRVYAVASDFAGGSLLEAPRGAGGFGYDPVFYMNEAGKTFAELSREEKNRLSHRGKAFRRMLSALAAPMRSV